MGMFMNPLTSNCLCNSVKNIQGKQTQFWKYLVDWYFNHKIEKDLIFWCFNKNMVQKMEQFRHIWLKGGKERTSEDLIQISCESIS